MPRYYWWSCHQPFCWCVFFSCSAIFFNRYAASRNIPYIIPQPTSSLSTSPWSASAIISSTSLSVRLMLVSQGFTAIAFFQLQGLSGLSPPTATACLSISVPPIIFSWNYYSLNIYRWLYNTEYCFWKQGQSGHFWMIQQQNDTLTSWKKITYNNLLLKKRLSSVRHKL